MQQQGKYKGEIIVIEGTDSSGKGTQTDLLYRRFRLENIGCEKMSFPRYNTPTGRIIGQCYLGKKDLGEKLGWEGDYKWFGDATKVDPKIISQYYAADRKAAVPEINRIIDSGKNLILDRWVESNMGHQAGKAKQKLKREDIIKYIQKLEYETNELPKPDKIFFLYVPTEIAFELRKKRDGNKQNLDGHENSFEHLKSAEETYLQLAKEYNWTMIECTRGKDMRKKEDIHEEIYKIIRIIL